MTSLTLQEIESDPVTYTQRKDPKNRGLQVRIPCPNPKCNKKSWKFLYEIRRQEDIHGPGCPNGKYCSLRCAQARDKPERRKRETVPCGTCGTELQITASRKAQSKSGIFFCSRTCQGKAMRLDSGVDIRRPSHYGTAEDRGKRSQAKYRAIAFAEYPQRCNRCGYDDHPDILVVHHKDRCRENNDINNLEVLCRNCHAVEHYKEKYPLVLN